MSRPIVLALFFLAVFLQSGTYGLTFLLPELFAGFDANEKDVGKALLLGLQLREEHWRVVAPRLGATHAARGSTVKPGLHYQVDRCHLPPLYPHTAEPVEMPRLCCDTQQSIAPPRCRCSVGPQHVFSRHVSHRAAR